MNNNTLIYDDNCPLCVCYTNAFVKYGFLKADERKPFSKIENELLNKIDFEKGKNEIPLINTETGKTLYGIDALLEILDKKIPFIKSIGNIKPVKWFLIHLYKLISYNRKVIVAKKCGPGTIDCEPEFNALYRIAFMVFFLVFNTLMLSPVHNYLLSTLPYYHLSAFQMQAAHFALVLCNCAAAFFLPYKKALEYLGQVNMLASITVLLLLLITCIAVITPVSVWITTCWLIGTAMFVGKSYFTRMKYAGILHTKNHIVAINLAELLFFLLYLFI